MRFGKQNLKIPKGTDPQSITYEQVLEWAAAEEKKGRKPKAKAKTPQTKK